MCLSSNAPDSFRFPKVLARLSGSTRAVTGHPLSRSGRPAEKRCAYASKKTEAARVQRQDRTRGVVTDCKMVFALPLQLMLHSAFHKRYLSRLHPPNLRKSPLYISRGSGVTELG